VSEADAGATGDCRQLWGRPVGQDHDPRPRALVVAHMTGKRLGLDAAARALEVDRRLTIRRRCDGTFWNLRTVDAVNRGLGWDLRNLPLPFGVARGDLLRRAPPAKIFKDRWNQAGFVRVYLWAASGTD
jgi:hypothetical protein